MLAVLAYTPAWASVGDTQGGGSNNDVPVAGAYASFVTATVNHFKNRVSHYELWNEPNLSVFFEGTSDDYNNKILVPGADALHAACATCLVVAPGLAAIAGKYDVWLDAALTAAQSKIDIISAHVYADFPADNAAAGVTADSFFNKLDQHRVIKLGGITIYEGPLSYREVMLKHSTTQPFWMTEAGLEAPIGNAAAEAKQVSHYRHLLEAMLTRTWWQNTIFYEGFDEPPATTTFGMVLHDDAAPGGYRKKPVMDLLSKAAGAQPLFGGTGTDCDDGLDNDGDGLIDYPNDPSCTSAATPSEVRSSWRMRGPVRPTRRRPGRGLRRTAEARPRRTRARSRTRRWARRMAATAAASPTRPPAAQAAGAQSAAWGRRVQTQRRCSPFSSAPLGRCAADEARCFRIVLQEGGSLPWRIAQVCRAIICSSSVGTA